MLRAPAESDPSWEAVRDTVTVEEAQIASEEHPQKNKLDHDAIIKFPLTTESAMKKIEGNDTLVFVVDVKANKRQIQQAVRKLYDTDVAEANTLISLMETGKHMFNWLLGCFGCCQKNWDHLN
ncbi:hypothetical protein P7K49_026496 [Saguinus oedipus]|uniref:60S ribosomal protein L23a n=1 Tax=Saguinus oedipus TaxID=9490 RepID=A0ABQ9UE69_SAGOE|nr:hypothetical protein P7K49_026496 [Saguinus oedipus]